jgi:outer membrane receptor for ferrienterochelin and colicins
MKSLIKVTMLLACLLFYNQLKAQTPILKGVVKGADQSKEPSPLPGAVVLWIGTDNAVPTNENGAFELPVNVTLPHKLLVSFIGYKTDTILVVDSEKFINIILNAAIDLKQIDVTARNQTTDISTLKLINSELIKEGELQKAACCNLSESFETNPSVDVNYSDAVTGAKEIQLLGLSGIYTQTLTENIPALRGLAVPYGLNYVPGPWMESIQVSKGAGSVANGYDAITGQINIEFKKPEKSDPFFLNLFADNEGRVELNTINNISLNKKWKYMLLAHGSFMDKKSDHNGDGFLDQPLTKQLNFYNRLFYHSGNKLEGQVGVKGLYEDRLGGQTFFNPERDKGTTNYYGLRVTTKRFEIYTKSGLVYPKLHYKSMGLQTDFTYHNQEAYFGLKNYSGIQKSFYTNYSYINIIGTTENKIKAGVDFKYDNYSENYNDSVFERTESVPGVFAEYTFGGDDHKFGAIIGLRADNHNLFGNFISPRMHLKYNITPEVILRVSGGRGFRSPNPYADNIGVMASSKILSVIEKPQLEEAWNGGANLTLRYKLFGKEGSLAGDFYHTEFVHQLIIDQYSDPDAVLYYNLDGSSYATSFQVTLIYEVFKNMDMKIAYKTDNVKTDYLSLKAVAKPLVAKEKAMLNLAYKTNNELWIFDGTLQWEGAKPLPIMSGHNHDANSSAYSVDYFQLMAQVTKVFKKFEAYIGGENLLDYTQHNPIVGADNPFGNTFDATGVWGPIMGRKIYAGIRLSVK